MIRNLVLVRLRPGVDPARLDEALAAIHALDVPGRVASAVGRDLGLREGGWDGAITSDFADEAAYRAYDLDEEHNRIRRELFAPISAEIARVQLAV